MSITIDYLRVLEGPNIFYPQAGVAARLATDADVRDELGRAIKTWAQSVGLIIGYLRMKLNEAPPGWLLEVSYTCNHPALGGAILRHAVEDLLAAERQDEDYEHDDALFEVRRQRMREDPVLPLLQLRAEAQGRGLPVLAVGDGSLQIGTGAGSWRFDPSALSLGIAVTPPWETIRSVPLVAVGGQGAPIVAEAIAAATQRVPGVERAIGGQAAPNGRVVCVTDGDFDAIRNALLDQSATAIVTALDLRSALERGLPFNRCVAGVVLGIAALPEEEALAAGLPALVAAEQGVTILRGDDQRAAALARRTAAPVILLRSGVDPALPENQLLAGVVAAVQETLDQGLLD